MKGIDFLLGSRAGNELVWKSCAFMVLLALCFALRELTLRLSELASPTVRADAAEYYFYTTNLERFGVYSSSDSIRGTAPTTHDFRRPPGLPLLALPLAHPAETLVPRFLFAQTIASVAAGVLVFWVGLRLAGFTTGCLALFLYSIGPHLINANLYFLTE
ncbi:MAG: hypothetical protein ACKPE6_17520, partial [Gammaproteobacteria bacterium]